MEVKAIRLFFVRIRTGHEKFTRIAIFKKLKINWGIPNFQGQAGMKIYQFYKFVTLWKSKTHLKWLQPTNFMSSLKLPKFNFHAARWTIEGNMDIGTGKTLTILSKNCVLIIIIIIIHPCTLCPKHLLTYQYETLHMISVLENLFETHPFWPNYF